MSDFYKQCSIDIFGEDYHDMAGITHVEEEREGKYRWVLCEDCGSIQVNSLGECVSTCSKDHREESLKGIDDQTPGVTTCIQFDTQQYPTRQDMRNHVEYLHEKVRDLEKQLFQKTLICETLINSINVTPTDMAWAEEKIKEMKK